MARVTARSVVNVASYTAMARIGGALIVLVAGDTGKCCVIRGVGVAIRAGAPLALVRAGINREPGVIESGSDPSRSGVAGLAGGREGCGRVVRVRRALVFRAVTRIAVRRCIGVVAVQVAIRAGHADVGARQREPGRVVIERGPLPSGCVVADVALLRKTSLSVIRIRRAGEIRQVTGDAARAQTSELSVDVAGGAGDAHMGAGQRERGSAVVKAGTQPSRRGVARRTVGREAGLEMVRIGRAVVVLRVASEAVLRRSRELAVDVAGAAGDAHVRTRQRKLGQRVVIETRSRPGGSRMAGLTGGRETRLDVAGVGRAVEVVGVAAETVG